MATDTFGIIRLIRYLKNRVNDQRYDLAHISGIYPAHQKR